MVPTSNAAVAAAVGVAALFGAWRALAARHARLRDELQRLQQRQQEHFQQLHAMVLAERARLERLLKEQAALPPSTLALHEHWLASASDIASTPRPCRSVGGGAAPDSGGTPPLPPTDSMWAAAESLFARLPQEDLQRVLASLTPSAIVRCERVCREWRSAVAGLTLWSEWRAATATMSETSFVVPGRIPLEFGAAPVVVTDEVRDAGRAALALARATPAERLCLATCGSSWTVLSMSANGTPSAIQQHQARDFVVCCCAASGLVFSGDKEGQLRTWCARSGVLLSRIAFLGGSVRFLAASAAHGHVHAHAYAHAHAPCHQALPSSPRAPSHAHTDMTRMHIQT